MYTQYMLFHCLNDEIMGTLRDFFRDILSRSHRDQVKSFWVQATRFHCFELSHSLMGPPQKMTHGAGFRGAGAVGNRTCRTGSGICYRSTIALAIRSLDLSIWS